MAFAGPTITQTLNFGWALINKRTRRIGVPNNLLGFTDTYMYNAYSTTADQQSFCIVDKPELLHCIKPSSE